MSYEDLLVEMSDGVAAIVLNRPAKRNALRVRTFEELIAALRAAAADETIGVVSISGAGPSFCAGGDMEMAQTVLTSEHAGRHHFFSRMIELSRIVLELDKPVLCAVQGACVGGGAELVTFADIVIAGESATFRFNGTEIGGGNWWGATQLLPLLVGMRRAEELLYLSSAVGAAAAERMGLVTQVVPDGELEATARAICGRILDLSEDGIRLTKAGIRSTKELLLSSMSSAAEANLSAFSRPGMHEAFEAFLERRPMDWRELRAKAAAR
jgi:enoyl-CoA hydratase/carnithine racemase